MSLCTDPGFLTVLKFVNTLITIAKIGLPVLIMVMASMDFSKTISAGSQEAVRESAKKLINRLIAAIIVFYVPTAVTITIRMADESFDMSACFNNIDNIDYYKELEEQKQLYEESLYNNSSNKSKATTLENNAIKNSSTSSSKTGSAGTVVGQKYNLTEEQLRGLATICQREQGTAVGAAAEASLMANRFELFGSKYGTGATGLYNYVADCGWFGKGARSYMSNTSGLKDDILASVREVLVLGNRTLDLFVDEHDCIDCGSYGFDVVKIETDGKVITTATPSELKNHSNYVKNKTKIYNRYSAIYTFSTFPTPSSDPFGYTDLAKNTFDNLNKKGD